MFVIIERENGQPGVSAVIGPYRTWEGAQGVLSALESMAIARTHWYSVQATETASERIDRLNSIVRSR